MIHLLVTRGAGSPVRAFLRRHGRSARRRMRFAYYDEARPRPGTWIFADLERLAGGELARAHELYDELDGCLRLNDPRRSLLRPALLSTLFERGINEFRAGPVTAHPARWPVFLRGANDHEGNRTPLLRSESELRAAIETLPDRDRLLMVEFLDTRGPDGLYRKYSAFRIGDAIVARHIFFGRDWMLKNADYVDAACVQEELEYVGTNPHAKELRAIFDAAHIEYGRIDYAMFDGKPQVWEINTNPMIMGRDSFVREERRTVQASVLPKLLGAFAAIDSGRRWWQWGR